MAVLLIVFETGIDADPVEPVESLANLLYQHADLGRARNQTGQRCVAPSRGPPGLRGRVPELRRMERSCFE